MKRWVSQKKPTGYIDNHFARVEEHDGAAIVWRIAMIAASTVSERLNSVFLTTGLSRGDDLDTKIAKQ